MICDLPDLPSVSLQVFCNHLLKNKITDHDLVRDVAFPFHCALCCSESRVVLCVSKGDTMNSSRKAKYCFQQILLGSSMSRNNYLNCANEIKASYLSSEYSEIELG